jgi:hypothetical protein
MNIRLLAPLECDESIYWMELLLCLPQQDQLSIESLKGEATEILKITIASILTARSRQ